MVPHTHRHVDQFKCEDCGDTFEMVKFVLKAHKIHVEGVKLIKCDKCDKTFLHESQKKRRVLTHMEDAKYHCSSSKGYTHCRVSIIFGL